MDFRVTLRAILVCLVASAASVGIVLWSLNVFPPDPSDQVYSPYWQEISRLLRRGQEGMTLEEAQHLRDLLDKNRDWHEQYEQGGAVVSPQEARALWQARSSKLAPALAVIWAALVLTFSAGRKALGPCWSS